jgi:hypothetical protein
VPPARTTSRQRAPTPAALARVTAVRPHLAASASASRQRGATALEARRERVSGTRLALLEKGGLVARSEAPFTIAGVTHTPFEVRKRGLPFFDRGGRIHEQGGRPTGVAGRTSFPPVAMAEPGIDRRAVVDAARAAVGADVLLAPPRLRLGWLAHEDRSRLAFEVELVPRAPVADWRVWIDAATGAVLGRVDRIAHLEGTGVVFETNPRDSKTPTPQPLRELDPGGNLKGRVTAVFDELAPGAFAPDLHFEFPTLDPRFVQTSVYRGLTETALLAEQHGFPPILAPIPAFTGLIDPFTGEALNNAFYVPSIPAFGFGDGDGDVLANLGTDIDVPAHEFGHHVFEVLVEPQIFSFEDPVLAMAEGVSDTFSFLVGGDARVGNSVVPGQKSLRNLANDASFPEALDPSPHRTGRVYGGANRDIARKIGNDAFTDLLIAALARLDPEADHTDYPEAFLEADQALNGGANATLLTQVFQSRGFDDLELPPEFQGQLVEGILEGGFLGDGEFHFYVFTDLPPSASLAFESTGTGDVDLFVSRLGERFHEPAGRHRRLLVRRRAGLPRFAVQHLRTQCHRDARLHGRPDPGRPRGSRLDRRPRGRDRLVPVQRHRRGSRARNGRGQDRHHRPARRRRDPRALRRPRGRRRLARRPLRRGCAPPGRPAAGDRPLRGGRALGRRGLRPRLRHGHLRGGHLPL